MIELDKAALLGATGLGAYELYHHHRYGNFGFGNPYRHHALVAIGGPYGYGVPYGYAYTGVGYPHHHRHRIII